MSDDSTSNLLVRGRTPRLFTPKGFQIIAQGCRLPATLGQRESPISTLKGLHKIFLKQDSLCNPFRVGLVVVTFTQGGPAFGGLPWALLSNRFAVGKLHTYGSNYEDWNY